MTFRAPLQGDTLRYAPPANDPSDKRCVFELTANGSEIDVKLDGCDRAEFCGHSAFIEGAYKRYPR